ncbi:hypothetical protein ACFZAV_38800 [Streptomyces sp. NPDC008343]|uniref:hypothetical protein n=1 Tax=Streptomyces sp. NPDC008343 TaxID=3364828 RepID=UPI0036EBC9F4
MGPQVLGRAHPAEVVGTLADLGLSMLIFLAGYEIGFPAIRNPQRHPVPFHVDRHGAALGPALSLGAVRWV